MIEGVQCLLQKTYEESVEQIRYEIVEGGYALIALSLFSFAYRLLRSHRYKLQKDLTDKFGALDIDGRCAELTDSTPGLGYSLAAVKVQGT